MKKELNIMDLVDMLVRRWWIMLVSMILVGVMSLIFTEVFVQPSYRSEGALYVSLSDETQMNQSMAMTITASQQIVGTYAEILKRRTFLESISEDVEHKYTVSQLKGMISISSVNDTEIMQISVVSGSPEDSYAIAHSVLMRAPDELVRVVEAGSVKLLDDAKKNDIPVSPNVKQNTFVGALLGIIIGAAIIFFLELADTRVKDAESLIAKYQEPVLGEIPSLTEHKR